MLLQMVLMLLWLSNGNVLMFLPFATFVFFCGTDFFFLLHQISSVEKGHCTQIS